MDLLKICVRIWAISGAHSLRTCTGRISGPFSLFGLRPSMSCCIPMGVHTMSSMVRIVDVGSVGMFSMFM